MSEGDQAIMLNTDFGVCTELYAVKHLMQCKPTGDGSPELLGSPRVTVIPDLGKPPKSPSLPLNWFLLLKQQEMKSTPSSPLINNFLLSPVNGKNI